MKYQAPFGSSDSNAPYVDRNTPSAVKGSTVPAAAIEDPQREMVALIEYAGLTPNDGDLTQVAKAIQTGQLNYAVAGGTANAVTVTLTPAPDSLARLIGAPIKTKFTAKNTGPMTVNPNGLGNIPLKRIDGGAFVGGEVGPGQISDICYDGTNFQLLGFSGLIAKPINSQTWAAAGTYNFTVPDGVYYVFAEVWGGGGGGGGTGAANSAGGGGGAGQYRSGWVPVTPGSTITVTVGAAGTAGANTGGNGGSGGTSSFGSLVSATGGSGGVGINGGAGGGGNGGSGGAGGTVAFDGASGQIGYVIGSIAIGGAGGGPFGGQGANFVASSGGSVIGRSGPVSGSGGGGGADGGAGGAGNTGRVTVQWS